MFDQTDLSLRYRAHAERIEPVRAGRGQSPLESSFDGQTSRRRLAGLLLALATRLTHGSPVASAGSSQASAF